MATATSVMAVVIPTQNRNAAVATDNMTKMMAINLKIPKYDISSAFDDRSVGGRSWSVLQIARIAVAREARGCISGAFCAESACNFRLMVAPSNHRTYADRRADKCIEHV
jgi:hypothetical protein